MSVIYLVTALLLLIWVVYFARFAVKFCRAKVLLSKIPSPPQHFLLGHLSIFLSDPRILFLKLRELSKNYYPIYRLSAFYIDIVNLIDPNDIEVLLSSPRHLSKSKAYTYLNQWLGTGLLTSTGTKWHFRRKILTPAFHFSILQQFLTVFNDETKHLVRKLEKECGRPQTDVIPFVTHFTLQSIGETAMGLTNMNDDAQRDYREAVYRIGSIIFERISKPWFRIPAIYNLSALAKEEKEVVKVLHKFSNGIIQQRVKDTVNTEQSYSGRKRQAMLDLLLSAKAQGAEIDYEGIREEVDTFMFEGHDTTSMAISFMLLTLANHKRIQSKILEEILEVVGPSETPTFSHLQELKFTERCIKEVLRLFPSVPMISRYAGRDFKTATGYKIPKGTIVHVHIFDMHRNPRLYPDPLKFEPDRFLPDAISDRHPFAYIPFSAGPRNCIGQRFALLELKAVLCGVLRKFMLEPVDGMHDIDFKPDLVLRPSGGVKVKFVARR